MKFKYLLIISAIFLTLFSSAIASPTYAQHSTKWQPSWNDYIAEALDSRAPEMLQESFLPEEAFLLCPGLKGSTIDQKKAFWSLFFASIAKYESGFDPTNVYDEGNSVYSEGLLQLSYGDETRHKPCDISKSSQNIHDPKVNLQCGVVIMKNQIKKRNELFPNDKHYYWSVLTEKPSKDTHIKVKKYFLTYYGQLGFCGQSTIGLNGGIMPGQKSAKTESGQQASQSPPPAQPSPQSQPQQVQYQTTLVPKAVLGCNNGQRCQEIDQVWSERLGPLLGKGNLILNHNTSTLADYQTTYFDKVQTPIYGYPSNQPVYGKQQPSSTSTQQYPSSQTPPPGHTPLPPSAWQEYQHKVGATATSPGKPGGETEMFSTLITKTVTVESPNYNNQQQSGQWTITLNPSQTCPNNICLNDITPKSKKADKKTGVMVHATVGNDYLGLTKGWSEDYWQDNSGLVGHTHYIFGRDGNYAQHASEFAYIHHSSSDSGDQNIPNAQIDKHTVAIEVANAMYNCKGICHRDSRTYKGKTATECGQEDCIVPSTLWGSTNNYLPQSDLTHGNVKKKVAGSKTFEKFADLQLKGLVKLVSEIMIRHNIHLDNLVRHSDNTWRGSGSTHTDPGPMFDWIGFKRSVCQSLNQYYGTQQYNCNNLNVCGGC